MLTLLKKKAEIPIVISSRGDFKVRKVIMDKSGHYLMIKGSFLQDEITVLDIICLTTEHQTT